MALYRGSTKLAGIGKGFSPENAGTTGQYLKKTATGYCYDNVSQFNPENTGTEGQVLTKTESGYAYCDSQGGSSGPRIDLVMVGGGGAGGGGDTYSYGGGGGGGGSVRACKGLELSSDSYNVVIGAGGTPGPQCMHGSLGNNGGNTCFGDIIAYGGGGGGCGTACCSGSSGYSTYGNGGGAGGKKDSTIPGNCPRLGNHGGDSLNQAGGGGGGAGSIGGNGIISPLIKGGNGGQGFYLVDYGLPGFVFGSGGGGGGTNPGCKDAGGGAGNGGNATANMGGGGGGSCASNQSGGTGGSGAVFIRYKTDGSCGINCTTGGDCCYTCDADGYCYVRFCSNGTFCIVC